MDKKYWIGRWERGETGWHEPEVEPALVARFSRLKPTRVFVPLCGKSRDLTWLASQGHEVVGVEAAEQACRAYFDENKIPFEESRAGAFTLFRGGKVSIFNGDFFDLGPSELGEIGAVYDRGALIALPSDIRTRYAAHLAGLARGSFEFLQIALERIPPDSNGPPFSVSAQEIALLYGKEFEIALLSREKIDMGDKSHTEESVYSLTAR